MRFPGRLDVVSHAALPCLALESREIPPFRDSEARQCRLYCISLLVVKILDNVKLFKPIFFPVPCLFVPQAQKGIVRVKDRRYFRECVY